MMIGPFKIYVLKFSPVNYQKSDKASQGTRSNFCSSASETLNWCRFAVEIMNYPMMILGNG